MKERGFVLHYIVTIAGPPYPGMPGDSLPNGPVTTGYSQGQPGGEFGSGPLTHMSGPTMDSMNNLNSVNSMNSSLGSLSPPDLHKIDTNSGQYVPVTGDQGVPTLRHPDPSTLNSHMTPPSQSSQNNTSGSHLNHHSPSSGNQQNNSSGVDNCQISDLNLLDPAAFNDDGQSNNIEKYDVSITFLYLAQLYIASVAGTTLCNNSTN